MCIFCCVCDGSTSAAAVAPMSTRQSITVCMPRFVSGTLFFVPHHYCNFPTHDQISRVLLHYHLIVIVNVCVNCTCQRPYRKFDGGVSRFSLARPAGGGPSTVLSLSHTPIYTRRCGSGGRGRGVLNTRAPAPAPIIATYASFGSAH